MKRAMKRLWQVVGLAMALAALGSATGCGDTTSTNTNQSCTEKHQCVNGACMCTEGPKKDSSCCDPNDTGCKGTANACDEFCKVCM